MAQKKTVKKTDDITHVISADATKEEKFAAAMAAMQKKHGADSVATFGGGSSNQILAVTPMPTGILPVDRAIGIGGIPRGRIIEVYGPESSGKTTLCLHTIKKCQEAGEFPVFVDLENALDGNHLRAIGISNLTILYPENAEQGLTMVGDLSKAGICLTVVDSVSALSPKGEQEEDAIGKQQPGRVAALMSQALRQLIASNAKSSSTTMFINQIRCIDVNTFIITSDGIIRADAIHPGAIGSNYIGVGTDGSESKFVKRYESGTIDGIEIHSKYRGWIATGLEHRSPVLRDGKYILSESRNIMIGDYTIHPIISIDVRKDLLNQTKRIDDINSKLSPKTKIYNLPEFLDERIACFMGMYYADGNILYDDISDYRIQFTETNRERYNLVRDLSVELFGDEVSSGTVNITIHGKQIVDFVDSFGIGRNSSDKVIPEWILYSNTSVLSSFIAGAFFDTHGFTDHGFIFSNENENSIMQFSVALYSLGIFADVRKDRSDRYNRLYITGNDAIEFNNRIGFLEESKQKLASYFTYSSTSRGKYDIVPASIVKEVLGILREIGVDGITKIPAYGNLNMSYNSDVNIGRNTLLEFLSSVLDIIDDDRLQNIYHLCKNNRFSEVIELKPCRIKAVDFSVSAADELFIAANFLTHNSKIGVMMGNPETTSGGNALKFYSSVRMDLRKVETLKQGDAAYANRVKVKIVKNKVAPPFREEEFVIYFDAKKTEAANVIEIGSKIGVIDKSGTWYSYNGERIGQGLANSVETLIGNPELLNTIYNQCKDPAVLLKKSVTVTDDVL